MTQPCCALTWRDLLHSAFTAALAVLANHTARAGDYHPVDIEQSGRMSPESLALLRDVRSQLT